MRFKQICNHPDQAQGGAEFDPRMSGKFARLKEIVETISERQEKLLVFTQYREMCPVLEKWLTPLFGRQGLVLDGQTAVAKRKGLVAQFQSENGPPFFVLSLKAGGTGLTLTAANHVVHFDRWWNPAVENQATDRAFRIGQHRGVLVHKFVCRGTLEERIDEMMEAKKSLAEGVLGADSAELPLTELSDAELLKLVSIDLNAVAGESEVMT
jgi:non-specific serine/threonine protein kinase